MGLNEPFAWSKSLVWVVGVAAISLVGGSATSLAISLVQGAAVVTRDTTYGVAGDVAISVVVGVIVTVAFSVAGGSMAGIVVGTGSNLFLINLAVDFGHG